MSDYELQLLTWRFAAMIGIVKPDELYATAEQVEQERQTWKDLMQSNGGMPLFDFDRCAEWMVEISGEPLERCRKIVVSEWGGDDD